MNSIAHARTRCSDDLQFSGKAEAAEMSLSTNQCRDDRVHHHRMDIGCTANGFVVRRNGVRPGWIGDDLRVVVDVYVDAVRNGQEFPIATTLHPGLNPLPNGRLWPAQQPSP